MARAGSKPYWIAYDAGGVFEVAKVRDFDEEREYGRVIARSYKKSVVNKAAKSANHRAERGHSNPVKITIAPSVRRKGKWDVFVGGIHRVTKATLKGAEGYAKRIQAVNPSKSEWWVNGVTYPTKADAESAARGESYATVKHGGRIVSHWIEGKRAKVSPSGKVYVGHAKNPSGLLFRTKAQAQSFARNHGLGRVSIRKVKR